MQTHVDSLSSGKQSRLGCSSFCIVPCCIDHLKTLKYNEQRRKISDGISAGSTPAGTDVGGASAGSSLLNLPSSDHSASSGYEEMPFEDGDMLLAGETLWDDVDSQDDGQVDTSQDDVRQDDIRKNGMEEEIGGANQKEMASTLPNPESNQAATPSALEFGTVSISSYVYYIRPAFYDCNDIGLTKIGMGGWKNGYIVFKKDYEP